MKNSSAIRWIIALSYVVLIYATLESIGAPIKFLRHHNLLRLSLLLFYGSCLLFLLFQLWRFHRTDWWRYIILCLIFIFAFFIGKSTGTPEEEIHFFEYGLVGILFARALEPHLKNTRAVILLAFFLGTLAGFIDEKIQGTLPTRHYDFKDVLMNALSVSFGLTVWMLISSSRIVLRVSLKK